MVPREEMEQYILKGKKMLK